MKKRTWLILAAVLIALALIGFGVYRYVTAPITLSDDLLSRIDFAAPWTHKDEFIANGFDVDVDKESDILLTYRGDPEILVSIRAFPGAANDPSTPVLQVNGDYWDKEAGNRVYAFDLFKDDAGFVTYYVDAANKREALEKVEALIESLYTRYSIR